MKFALSALLGLASLVLAQDPNAAACPTATRTIQNRGCNKSCAFSDCTLQTTIQKPCNCPSALPTATLIAPCEADCPYQGCAIDFRTAALPCPTTPSTTRRWTSTTSTSTTKKPTGVITSVITLPPKSTSTPLPCPKVTSTTSPAGCEAIRCPVPTCRATSTMVVPCGCEPKTVLFVTGCATACAEGCLTRTQTAKWIKGLLAVPFVLYSQPHGVFEGQSTTSLTQTGEEAHRRYSEILRDVELMIDDHIIHQNDPENPFPSKLKLLVPSIGPFFTRLPLEAAFKFQDRKRYISSRRFVSPSFNDVRLILNSAQMMAVTTYGTLQLATFDGDVTLYDDGESLEPTSPIIPRLIDLLRKNVKIGIVTAAGYTTADKYYARLHGLLDVIANTAELTPTQKQSLIIMGGEANYLFEFSPSSPHLLAAVPRERWLTPEMANWDQRDIAQLLDVAEAALRDCIKRLNLPATLMRKDRAVGIIPDPPETTRIPRESLEETVLVVQKILELSSAGRHRRVPFCAFNGGRDVFVDIGDKSWGVNVCQRWFGASSSSGEGGIKGDNTLHVGDQFLSAGANDFRARSVGTTAWIASPAETVDLLDELAELMGKKMS
ncbi:IMP-specific 5'-nucleotidase-domain-containing protein [Chaetomidium leptoderma]|uniref:IMP-specific 5'-nucleotidase 1 n=1 Tax=Chaetomidium leptoderma TaxID=669021 RepID=A0AAN6ZSZ2_9PEZI|nr:IMP-specific 5'-nucleotidase-domain-containing protein [Chaetomidium leptoderma]